jgi:formate dehydrogenase iron-sulfur subunit
MKPTLPITRRDFLKWSGASALALTAIPIFDQSALASYLGSETNADQVGILIDTTKCIGCRACQLACKKKNNLPEDADRLPPQQTFPRTLSATTFTLLEFHHINSAGDAPVFRTVKKQCMHCLEPACAAVCPVGAIQKTARGPVVYDADKCLGCRYCMAACPFNVPKFEWDSANPRIRKCNMCADLIEQGEQPACVAGCPTGALKFGTRKELIAEAQARVSQAADKYVPYIYGLSEVGGTSVLYLANVAFTELGMKMDLPKDPMPELTISVMEKVPGVAIGVALLMGGVAWWRGRKEHASREPVQEEMP